MTEKRKARKSKIKKLGKGKGLQYPRTAYFEPAQAVMQKHQVQNVHQVRWKLLFHHLFELISLVAGRTPQNEQLIGKYKKDLAALDGLENSLSMKTLNSLYVEE